jgi:hypothetical protein
MLVTVMNGLIIICSGRACTTQTASAGHVTGTKHPEHFKKIIEKADYSIHQVFLDQTELLCGGKKLRVHSPPRMKILLQAVSLKGLHHPTYHSLNPKARNRKIRSISQCFGVLI